MINEKTLEAKAATLTQAFLTNERVQDACRKVNLEWCCYAYNKFVMNRTPENKDRLRMAYEVNVKTIMFINNQIHNTMGIWLLSKNPNPERKQYSVRVQEMRLSEMDEIIEEYRFIDWKIKDAAELDSYKAN